MQAEEFNSDQNIEDQGWVAMKDLLDQEMPVKKKKRRPFFFLFLFGVILTSLVATIFWYGNTNNQIIENKNEKSETSKTNQKQSFNSSLSSKSIEDQNSLTNKNIKESDHQTKLKNTKNNDNHSKVSVKDDHASNVIDQNLKLNTPKLNIIPPTLNDEIKTSSTTLLKDEPDTTNKELVFVQPITMNTYPLEYNLNISEIEIINHRENENEENITEELIKNQQNNRKLAWKTEVGILADIDNQLDLGGYLGGIIQFPISKKLSLNLGLNYSLINKSSNFLYNDNQQALYDSSESSSLGTQYDSIDISVNNILRLERFHQIESPISVEFNFNNKFSIFAGGYGSILLKEKLVSEQYYYIPDQHQNQITSSDFDPSNLDESNLNTNSYQEKDFWKKLNLGILGGINYQINHRFGIKFSYHRDLFTYLRSEKNASDLAINSTFQGAESFQLSRLKDESTYSQDLSGSFLTPNGNNQSSLFYSGKSLNQNFRLGFNIRF